MKAVLQASTSIHMNGAEEWIHILPTGFFTGNDGRGPYLLSDAAKVIANSLRPKTDMVVDRDHEIMFAAQGTHKKAAGWIKSLEVHDDGIWGRVEWTAAAKEELEKREYRYLSPVFSFDQETREISKIHHVSLTNDPNLELTAVASAFRQQNTQTQELDSTMNKTLLAIAAVLGLANTAAPEAILKGVQDLSAQHTQLETEFASVRTALGVADDADTKTVIEAAAQKIEGGAKPDPSAYVPMSAHKELADNFAALQKTISSDRASSAVEAAMKEGKISPAQKDWAVDYASKDPGGFAAYIEAAPKIIEGGESASSQAPGSSSQPKLSDEEIAVCTQLGISQEDYMKAGSADKEAA